MNTHGTRFVEAPMSDDVVIPKHEFIGRADTLPPPADPWLAVPDCDGYWWKFDPEEFDPEHDCDGIELVVVESGRARTLCGIHSWTPVDGCIRYHRANVVRPPPPR